DRSNGQRRGHFAGEPEPHHRALVFDQSPRPGPGSGDRARHPRKEPRQPARGQRSRPRHHVHGAADGGGIDHGVARRKTTMTKTSILVVDDDVDTCRNLSDILTDLGYRVDVAHDGPSALELVRRHAYDIALLDYKMPGMDGLTLYREIKGLRAGTV